MVDRSKTPAAHLGNNFDVLRICLASAVLLSHSFELVPGERAREPVFRLTHTLSSGALAVDCFFVISGFLIAKSWEREPNVGAFLRKRVLRIVPGYLVAFLLSVLIAGAIGAADATSYLRALDPGVLLGQMVRLDFPQTPPTFADGLGGLVNGSMWTIQYEFLCYLMLLGFGVVGLLRSRTVMTVLWLSSASLFIVVLLQQGTGTGDATLGGGYTAHRMNLLRFVPFFLAGAAINRLSLHRFRSRWLVGGAACLLVAGLSFRPTAEISMMTVGAYLLIVLAYTPIPGRRILRYPDVSYGLYLYAWPVQIVLIHSGVTAPLAVLALSMPITLVFALASWFVVEKPAIAIRSAGWSVVKI